MKIGAPGEHLALSQRKRKVCMPNAIKFEVLDHDMCIKTYLVPRVITKINCPVNRSNSFKKNYDSETVMILKEGLLHPSSDSTHAS